MTFSARLRRWGRILAREYNRIRAAKAERRSRPIHAALALASAEGK